MPVMTVKPVVSRSMASCLKNFSKIIRTPKMQPSPAKIIVRGSHYRETISFYDAALPEALKAIEGILNAIKAKDLEALSKFIIFEKIN